MTTTQQTLPACSELRDEATRNEAFDRLVGVLLRPIYWHVRRLVVEHDEAEEITQEAFVRAFEQFDRFRGGDGELRAWVYRIATNLSISVVVVGFRVWSGSGGCGRVPGSVPVTPRAILGYLLTEVPLFLPNLQHFRHTSVIFRSKNARGASSTKVRGARF